MKRHSSNRSRSKSSPPAVATFVIEDTTHEGNGVARQNGKVTFVAGAITGETVEAKVVKTGRQFDQAGPIKWLEVSPHRVSSPCQYFAQCGGCQLQHIDISEQRNVKANWLSNQFRKLSLPETLTRLEGEPLGYRRRARIATFAKGGEVNIGFRAQASNEIIDVHNCVVLTFPLQEAYQSLREAVKGSTIAGKIGHIELLEDAAGVTVILRLTRAVDSADRMPIEQWAAEAKVNLFWQAPEQDRIEQAEPSHYVVDEQTIQFHAQDFIQVNADINQKMVQQAMAWLDVSREDTILDLFCGAGNFSLPLAQRAGRVLAVEALESMVAMGRENAARAELDNLEFMAADLTQAPPNRLKKAKISKALLDPPRAGAFEFLPTLVRLKPKQILYVSCNAATLARDAAYLIEQGYRVSKVCMMDMFPQTSHVETMMLLQN
ncbi:23S rRNA (uracil(1939)-C(5))-methyltransferase RlmD [Marinomonas ostreistagni]|uniref:23S rRNA (uracil(1939)-C(5))-methyltransferase RlmD n=1 Tax=Marinomonas ostreistagni TaxID=359209 RepID=UPI00195041D4|nr:23S rRNA (uracil(1939)-C(5))-methyltransferase RlmD [Marinomonas ostreistagni]MBM6551641.1 23S rRNA (uracil(1939)-C(5))-methyltransferase RlmD [Marinomonas ostreistagni]